MTDFSAQMDQILTGYNLEVQRAAKSAAKKAAEETVRKLKATSPKGVKRVYANGWKVQKEDYGGSSCSYVVYNSKRPGLTSPLEFGHVARNQFGSWGRVPAVPHIAKAADEGIKIFEDEIRTQLG